MSEAIFRRSAPVMPRMISAVPSSITSIRRGSIIGELYPPASLAAASRLPADCVVVRGIKILNASWNSGPLPPGTDGAIGSHRALRASQFSSGRRGDGAVGNGRGACVADARCADPFADVPQCRRKQGRPRRTHAHGMSRGFSEALGNVSGHRTDPHTTVLKLASRSAVTRHEPHELPVALFHDHVEADPVEAFGGEALDAKALHTLLDGLQEEAGR